MMSKQVVYKGLGLAKGMRLSMDLIKEHFGVEE